MSKKLPAPKTVESLLDQLGPMQRLYAEARMSGLAPLEAAKAAGYSHASIQWHSLEKHPKIAPLIRLMNERGAERYDLSRDDVISGFMDAVNAASTSTELTAAWREIGRMLGHYSPDQIQVTHQVENMTLNKLEAMNEDELLQLAEMEAFTLPREHDLVASYEVIYDGQSDDEEKEEEPEAG